MELTISSHKPFCYHPPYHHHGAVMVDVQEGDLVVLLAKYEEECIEEFNDFGEEVEPDDTGHLKKWWVGGCSVVLEHKYSITLNAHSHCIFTSVFVVYNVTGIGVVQSSS